MSLYCCDSLHTQQQSFTNTLRPTAQLIYSQETFSYYPIYFWKSNSLYFMSLILFRKTLSNEFENHFLVHMSAMNSSEVMLFIQSWLDYGFFLDEGPR